MPPYSTSGGWMDGRQRVPWCAVGRATQPPGSAFLACAAVAAAGRTDLCVCRRLEEVVGASLGEEAARLGLLAQPVEEERQVHVVIEVVKELRLRRLVCA